MNDLFLMYAAANEGDLTVGRSKINKAAEILARRWNLRGESPNDPENYYAACDEAGFDFDDLLYEEVRYFERAIQERI